MVDHIPVLLKEVVEFLEPKKGKKIIDATLGLGGHTKAFLEKGAVVLALEWDEQVLSLTKKHLSCPDASWKIVLGNFADIEKIAKENGFVSAEAVFFDLGISTWHYKKSQRGFSFFDQSLDMRISSKTILTAERIVNSASKEELTEIFSSLVQQNQAGKIADQIIEKRPIRSAKKLEKTVKEVISQSGKVNPATKVFLALRIAVNSEFDNLVSGLIGAVNLLETGGRLAVISFHSGEDRIVKLYFKKLANLGKIKILTKKAIRPSKKEVNINPSARSALLRVVEKT
jgi:16S rRNA (cytosine1402-N4)-methyltransferase